MATREPIMPTTCDHCGDSFNTSRQHPRQYCSIACEEGRGPLADDHPSSANFWLHVQGNPEAIVNRAVVACGLKRTCYSPDWHRDPSDYHSSAIVDHDEANEILVRLDDVFLGTVIDYSEGVYTLEREDMETGETHRREVEDCEMLAQLRRDQWWID